MPFSLDEIKLFTQRRSPLEDIARDNPRSEQQDELLPGRFTLDEIKQFAAKPRQEDRGFIAETADVVGDMGARLGATTARGITEAFIRQPLRGGIIAAKAMGLEAEGAQKFLGKTEQFQENLQQDLETKYARHAEGSMFSSPLAAAETVGDVVMQVGTLLGSGGVALPALVTGQAGSSGADARQRMLAKGASETEAERVGIATTGITWLTSYLTNKITLGQAEKVGFKSIAQRVEQTLAKRLTSLAKEGAKRIGPAEAFEEVVEGTVADVTRWALENDKDAFQGFWGRRFEDAVAGGIGGTIAGGIHAATRQPNLDHISERIRELEKTPDGLDLLKEYGSKESPSRADLAKLGLKEKLSAPQRQWLAQVLDPEALESTKHFMAEAAKTPVDPDEPIAEVKAEEAQTETPPTEATPEGPLNIQPQVESPDMGLMDQFLQRPEVQQTLAQPEPRKAGFVKPKAEVQAEPTPIVEPAVKPQAAEVISPEQQPSTLSPLAVEQSGTLTIPTNLTLSSMLDRVIPKKLRKAALEATVGLDPTGLKLKDYTKAVQKSRNLTAAANVRIEKQVYRLRDIVTKELGLKKTDAIPADLDARIDDYIQGRSDGSDLSPKIAAEAMKMRQHVDENSRRIRKSGILTKVLNNILPSGQTLDAYYSDQIQDNQWGRVEVVDDMMTNHGATEREAHAAASFLLNEGTYVHRTYQAFGNPDWADQVDQATRDAYIDYLQFGEVDPKTGQRKRAGKQPYRSRHNAELKLTEVLDTAARGGHIAHLVRGGEFLALNDKVLKRRKNIPIELENLLGLDRSALQNYVKTAFEQHRLINSYLVMEDARNDLMGKLWWSKDQATGDMVKLQLGAGPFSPLNNLYTTKEIRDTLENMAQAPWTTRAPKWLQILFKAETAVQKGLTALSPTANFRQLLGNPTMLLRNGNYDPVQAVKYAGEFFKIAKQHLHQGSRVKGDTSEYQRLIELGLADSSVELKTMERVSSMDDLEQLIQELELGPSGQTLKATKALDAVSKLYGLEDTVFKYMSWKMEMKRYSKIYPNMSKTELEEFAADLAKKSLPTFDNMPPVIQQLRTIPFRVGPFLTFPWSMWQSTYGTLQLISDDWYSSDDGRKAIAVQRMVGSMAAAAGPAAMVGVAASILGWDDEELEALNEIGPEYSRWSRLLPLSERGSKIRLTNLGYIDPHGSMIEAIRAIATGAGRGEPLQGFLDGMKEVFSGIGRDKIIVDAFQQSIDNQDAWGDPIWNENDNYQQQWTDLVSHLVDQLQPGAVKLGREAINTARGFEKRSGARTLTSIAMTGLGIKTEDLDVDKQIGWALQDFKNANSDVKYAFKSLDVGGTMTPEIVNESLERAKERRLNSLSTMRQKYLAAGKVDPTFVDRFPALAAGKRLSDADVTAIITGISEEPLPDTIREADNALQFVQDPAYRQKIEAQRKELVVKAIKSSVADPTKDENKGSIQKSKEELDSIGMKPQQKWDMWVEDWKNNKWEESIDRAKKELQKKLKSKIIPQDQLQREATRKYAASLKRFPKNDTTKRTYARLGFTEQEARQQGFSEKDIIEFYPSPGVPQ